MPQYRYKVTIRFLNTKDGHNTIERASTLSSLLESPLESIPMEDYEVLTGGLEAESRFFFDDAFSAKKFLTTMETWWSNPRLYPGLIKITGEGFYEEIPDTI